MGGKQVKPIINEQEYDQKFRITAQNCQTGPVEDRQCNDVCCLVTFIILTLAFIGVGIYFSVNIDSTDFQRFQDAMANSTASSNSQSTKSNSPSASTQHLTEIANYHLMNTQSASKTHHQTPNNDKAISQFPDLTKALPWIVFMGIFSLILSIVLVIAVSKSPKPIIYGMMVFTFLLIVGGIIGGLVLGLGQLTIMSIIFGVTWGLLVILMLCCYRQQFEAAFVLMKVTGTFLKQRPSVVLASLFTMFISWLYFAFWLISFVGIQLDRTQWANSTTTTQQSGEPQYQYDYHDGITLLWLFLNLFYSYFLHYVMVFLIATATAMWYFNVEGNYILKGLGHIWDAHIGSLTFASMIVSIVGILKSFSQSKNDDNLFVQCCASLVKCCLTFIEEIIQVLNHNSIIVMSVTGEGFVDSAKNAIYLIYNNFGVFVAVDMVGFLLKICVLFVTILLPTALGLILLKLTYNQGQNEEDLYLLISGLIIFIICVLISMLTVTVLSQALSCIFILYCFDQRFKTLNYGVVNRVPRNLRGLFSEIELQSRSIDSPNLYSNSIQNKH